MAWPFTPRSTSPAEPGPSDHDEREGSVAVQWQAMAGWQTTRVATLHLILARDMPVAALVIDPPPSTFKESCESGGSAGSDQAARPGSNTYSRNGASNVVGFRRTGRTGYDRICKDGDWAGCRMHASSHEARQFRAARVWLAFAWHALTRQV